MAATICFNAFCLISTTLDSTNKLLFGRLNHLIQKKCLLHVCFHKNTPHKVLEGE